ncbi:MAG: hypothetical protein MZU95_14410, partial [Desulfomicrobium escambiense]|nr:hypothetical protein [Desulfomicrobium escambiense]
KLRIAKVNTKTLTTFFIAPPENIRNETISDIDAISKVTIAAFQNLAISNHTEQFIINALRDANVLTISLVAEVDGKVVGHIAFSPIAISDGSLNWYGLGPISVLRKISETGHWKIPYPKRLILTERHGWPRLCSSR